MAKSLCKKGVFIGKVLTLEDPLQEQCSSWFSKLESTQNLQEQPFDASVTKARCSTRCLYTKVRLNTPKNTQNSQEMEI